jgi:hypothetical protein
MSSLYHNKINNECIIDMCYIEYLVSIQYSESDTKVNFSNKNLYRKKKKVTFKIDVDNEHLYFSHIV